MNCVSLLCVCVCLAIRKLGDTQGQASRASPHPLQWHQQVSIPSTGWCHWHRSDQSARPIRLDKMARKFRDHIEQVPGNKEGIDWGEVPDCVLASHQTQPYTIWICWSSLNQVFSGFTFQKKKKKSVRGLLCIEEVDAVVSGAQLLCVCVVFAMALDSRVPWLVRNVRNVCWFISGTISMP